MTDVLHHIPQPRQFFREASRCVRSGGVIAMVEPWRTRWSELIYRNLHHEPFRPQDERWEFEARGPLSSANGALPWMIFGRDRKIFEIEFPEWAVKQIQPKMPFVYLLSGGFSRVTFQPGLTYPLWTQVERAFDPWMHRWAMFAYIVLQRL
jgi:SAM-dependent methyltransferase